VIQLKLEKFNKQPFFYGGQPQEGKAGVVQAHCRGCTAESGVWLGPSLDGHSEAKSRVSALDGLLKSEKEGQPGPWLKGKEAHSWGRSRQFRIICVK
jgi:hypothetical protein